MGGPEALNGQDTKKTFNLSQKATATTWSMEALTLPKEQGQN